MPRQAITANRLTDGAVVYLTDDGEWSERIADSRTATTKEEASALLAEAERAVARQIVVTPYLFALADGDGRPVRLRERIRAGGPTAGSDSAKQAGA